MVTLYKIRIQQYGIIAKIKIERVESEGREQNINETLKTDLSNKKKIRKLSRVHDSNPHGEER